MDIAYELLSPEVLRGIIEEFVLREGTDYGDTEYALEEKVRAVRRQLEMHKIKIVFDPKDETCSIIPAK